VIEQIKIKVNCSFALQQPFLLLQDEGITASPDLQAIFFPFHAQKRFT